jgi:hypothetical protein
MNERASAVRPQIRPHVEKEPEPANHAELSESDPRFVGVGEYCYGGDSSAEGGFPLAMHRLWVPETVQEKPVKIISYLGSLPDKYGNDGDFYLDEMSNMLYGPKTDGVWPEEGVRAVGICKRTFINLTRMHDTSTDSQSSFKWSFKVIFRFLIPTKLFKSMISLRTESRV